MRSTQTQTQTDYPSAFAIHVAAMVDTLEEPEQRNIKSVRRGVGKERSSSLI